MPVNYFLIPIASGNLPLRAEQRLAYESFCIESPSLLPVIIQYQKLAANISDRLSALEGNCPALICITQEPFQEPDSCACFSPWGTVNPNPSPEPQQCVQDYAALDYFAEDYVCTPQVQVGPF